jgi:hypothetical protein
MPESPIRLSGTAIHTVITVEAAGECQFILLPRGGDGLPTSRRSNLSNLKTVYSHAIARRPNPLKLRKVKQKMKRVDQARTIQSAPVAGDLEEQVRERAYQLYQERGEVPGFEIEDWLQAEAEIIDGQKPQKAA